MKYTFFIKGNADDIVDTLFLEDHADTINFLHAAYAVDAFPMGRLYEDFHEFTDKLMLQKVYYDLMLERTDDGLLLHVKDKDGGLETYINSYFKHTIASFDLKADLLEQ